MAQLNTADRLYLGSQQAYRAMLQGTRVWPKSPRLRNNFDGGSDGVSITPGNSGGASGDAFDQTIGTVLPAYSVTQHRSGLLSARMSTGATAAQCYVTWNALLGTPTNWYGCAYVYLAANPASTVVTARYFEIRSASALAAFFRPASAGNGHVVELADSSGSVQKVGTVQWAFNQWTRVEWHIVHSTTVGSLEVKLFNTAASTTPSDTVAFTNLNTGPSFASLRIGCTTSTANFPQSGGFMYLDDLDCGATFYPGP